ncbi:MAG: type III pantothenate kinase [Pseudomonadota bacterium]
MSNTVLLLDIGNSRVKWALAEGAQWLAEGASTHAESGHLFDEWDRFPAPSIAVASNVAGNRRAQPFSAYWQARGVALHWMQAGPEDGGVRNLYQPPQRLGSDRWAALIGARARVHGACLVVSAGTAVTVDALSENDEFLGGLILPGRRLMQESLAGGAHALENSAGHAVDFPRNTADAVASGIAAALTGSVQSGYRRLAAVSANKPACILTGGDAEWLAGQLSFGVIIAPKLVLEGLLIMYRGKAPK